MIAGQFQPIAITQWAKKKLFDKPIEGTKEVT